VFGDLAGLPPLLIHVAANEMLCDDAIRVADSAKRAGVDVTIDVVDEMFHVWHIFAGYVPEADEAVAKIGEYLRARI
jgi:acetyl esterase/lipase